MRNAFDLASGGEVPAAGKLAADAFYYREDFCFVTLVLSMTAGGGVALFNQTPPAGDPGQVRLDVTAVADRVFVNPPGAGGGASNTGIRPGGGQITHTFRRVTSVVQDGANRWSFRAGFLDTAGADATNGVYLEEDLAVHGDNFIRMCCAAAGVRTKTSTGVSWSVATENAGFVINAAGTSVQAVLDGVNIGAPVTTNIPAAAGCVWSAQFIKTLGAALRSITLLYAETYQDTVR